MIPTGAAAVPAHQTDTGAAIRVVDFAFEPAQMQVAAGTTVTWTNDGQAAHTVTADDGSFDSGRLDPGEAFSQRFDRPGTYAYHCGFHASMHGTVVVTEAPDGVVQQETTTPPAGEDSVAESHPTGGHAAETPPAGAATPTAGLPPTSAGASRELTPVDESRLAHIHAGTCDELGIVVYSLAGLRSYRLETADGAVYELISGTADVALTDLFGEPFSVHVHESVANKQVYLACADVGGQPPVPWTEEQGLTLEAREQNDSGYSGFVTLRPSAGGGTDINIFIAANQAAVEQAAAQPTPPPGATYTSPTFGYAIGYGPTWQVTEERSINGRDRFVLYNGTSYVTFTGAQGFGGDPQACVDDFVRTLTADPNVSNLRLATDENGQPLQGSTAATGAYAVYNHDYTFPDRVEPYTLFVGCVPLVPNQSVLAIVQNVPAADYNGQVAPRETLLRGLTLPQ
ncbi:MAG: cupredoxin family copper-binding protein [Thermomicrobiales bacterium]|nr:cupredoxin family copper-binding protein [Thermomicrobiales bacterium]